MDRAEKILLKWFPGLDTGAIRYKLNPDAGISMMRELQHETRLETIGHFIDQADENGFKTGIPAVSKQWLMDVLDGEETGKPQIDWETFSGAQDIITMDTDGMED